MGRPCEGEDDAISFSPVRGDASLPTAAVITRFDLVGRGPSRGALSQQAFAASPDHRQQKWLVGIRADSRPMAIGEGLADLFRGHLSKTLDESSASVAEPAFLEGAIEGDHARDVRGEGMVNIHCGHAVTRRIR